MRTIEEARDLIASLAEQEGEFTFAAQVRAGSWDHRSDVQAARSKHFEHRKLNTHRSYSQVVRDAHPGKKVTFWSMYPTTQGYKVVYSVAPETEKLTVYLDNITMRPR